MVIQCVKDGVTLNLGDIVEFGNKRYIVSHIDINDRTGLLYNVYAVNTQFNAVIQLGDKFKKTGEHINIQSIIEKVNK